MARLSVSSRNPLIFVFITRLIDAIGFGIVMPVLPQLLLSMGSPDIATATRTGGWLLVTYAILQFFCGPIIGNLSDRFGRRPVILVSLAAYGIDYLLMGFAPTIFWLFVGRAVAGVAGAVFVPANAYVADVTPPEQRARAFGIVSSAFGLGFIIGPAIGGLLGEIGPRAPFFAAALLAGLNFTFGLFVLPESLPPERRRAFDWRRANPAGTLVVLKRYPAVLTYVLAVVLMMVATNVYPSTWAFFMTAKFGWSPGWIGLTLVATGLSMAIVQAGLTGKIVAAIGERPAVIVGFGTAAAACIAYAFVPQGWMVMPVLLVSGLQAVTYPALNALMSREMPAESQGELQGGVASASSIANVIGPLLMTQAMALFTSTHAPVYFPGAAFILAAALNIAAVFVVLAHHRGLAREAAQGQA